jgi:inner membrane protein
MTETTHPVSPKSWLRTPAAKVGMILALLLVLQIPLSMVSGLINERQLRQADTVTDLGRGWGPEQTVTGPLLVVPYSWDAAVPPHVATTPRATAYVRIPASQLHVEAILQPQIRRRGLFRAAIYTAAVTLSGTFTIPDFAAAPGSLPTGASFDWQGARLILGASDLRGLPPGTALTWNGSSVPLRLAERQVACGLTLIDVPAVLTPAPRPGMAADFKLSLSLRGTQAFHIQPTATQSSIQISSPWATPGYIGASLPTEETPETLGFAASWAVAGDAESALLQQRGWAMPNCDESVDKPFFDQDRSIGVELREAVPVYLMVTRAQKYGVLFLALSFLTLFLFEAVARVRIHVIQYGLLGLSVSLFALVLISAAEPLGFATGYAVATTAVLAQASLYTLSVTRRSRLAATFAGVLGSLFAFLYVVLSLDAYALLAGTIALFTALSVVMVVTRRVNWDDAAGVA